MSSNKNNLPDNLLCLFCAEKSVQLLLDELYYYDKKYELLKNINNNCIIIKTSFNHDNIISKIRQSPPVFIRHVFPIQAEIINSTGDIKKTAIRRLKMLYRHITEKNNFSVQVKIYNNDSISGNMIRDAVQDDLKNRNIIFNKKNPEQVISIVIEGNNVYAGISYGKDNLSKWTAGEYRFRESRDQISRAEFKLMEAFQVFNTRFPENGYALDIGAAPGGWTRILLKNRLHVTAVDPAELDSRLKKNPFLEHYSMQVDDFLKINKRKFDIICNDMKADPRYSINLVKKLASLLTKSGTIISTLKLPKNTGYSMVMKYINELNKNMRLTGARQLYHNRNEITVAVKRK